MSPSLTRALGYTPSDLVGRPLATFVHEEFVPPPVRGMPVMGIVVCYTGKPEDGPAAYKPMLDLNPALNMAQPMPYVGVQSMLEPGQPSGTRNYWKADMYPEMPDEALDALLQAAAIPGVPSDLCN